MEVRRSEPAARRKPSRRARSAWVAFVACGLLATGLYAAEIAPAAAFAFVGLGSVVALFTGPRWHRTGQPRPWDLLGIAAFFFIAGALIRPAVIDSDGASALLADVFTVPGYLFMMACLATFLYARRGISRDAFIDGMIVCVGAGIASTVLFALPAASIEGRSVLVSAFAGLYPLFDVVLLLLITNLSFTTAVRQPSFVLLFATMLLIFVGDIAYAIIGTFGQVYGSLLLDLPFLLAYTMIGAAALHPSAADLPRAAPLPVQQWSWRRLMVIGPSLAVPFVLTAAIAGLSLVDRLIIGIGGAAIVLLLLFRAVSAVQSYATAQRRYRHQATHDPLTGLPNRRMLTAAVERMLDAGPPRDDVRIWMFFIDLDGFKFVNDSWGHPAGDQLIIDVGQRLRGCLPPAATVARLGGDEFVIVAQGDEATAMRTAREITDCVEQPLQVGNTEVVITASMGISSAGWTLDAEETAEALMRDADTAMYRTKAENRGRWTVFDASMHRAVRERIELEAALRLALGQDQLRLEYQPIVDLPTGGLSGAEALIRWDHPQRGLISPGVFIPIAEDSALIVTIGAWVVRQAVRQLADWRADGTVDGDFWMSVNVSPRQLSDPMLPQLVAGELMRWGVPAACVSLEITESVMVEGSTVTEQVLRELRALGVGIAVDDFGTGFSALGYLRRHPVTAVKIDRSFVAGLGTSAEDEEIVRAVAAMSSALELSVVAEGVETETQQHVLASLGVPLGQGWLWGRAVEPAAFAARWARTADAGPPTRTVPAVDADTWSSGQAFAGNS